MRQKATWIIPGLLLTLLLGLLWAIPAFAASAGTIGFKDGSDTISYVSLEGVGSSGNAISVTVTDSDLDTVLKRTPANNNLFCADASEDYVMCPELGVFSSNPTATARNFDTTVDLGNATDEDWHDVQDMNGDGFVDNRDFKGYNIATVASDANGDGTDDTWTVSATEVADATFSFDRGNGVLQVTGGTNVDAIGYHIKKMTVIGARNGTDRVTGNLEVDQTEAIGADITVNDGALNTAFDVGDTTANDPSDDFMPDESLIHNSVGTDTGDNLTWVELLSSKMLTLTTKDYSADLTSGEDNDPIEATIKGHIKAYNDGESGKPLNVEVTATASAQGTTPETYRVTEVSVTIASDCPAAAEDATGCNARTGAIGPWSLNTANDAWENPATASDDVNIVIEVAYVGSAATIYPNDTHRIGPKAEVGRVTVDTNAMATPISVILQETGAASGAFTAMLEICDSDDKGCMEATQAGEADEGKVQDTRSRTIMVPVDNEGDSIVVRYADADPSATRSATIALDATGPAFSDMAPASGTSGREDEPTVSFQVNDAESGLSSKDTDSDTIRIVAGIYNLSTKSIGDQDVFLRNVINPKAANNGYMTSYTLEEGSGTGELDAGSLNEYEIHWWAVAVDVSGNTSVSDQNSATKCTLPAAITASALSQTVDTTDSDKTKHVGCDPYKIRVDSAAPEMTDATTGVYMDGDEEKTGKATSVVARFNEALDCDTVSAEDFTVGGSAANGASCKGSNVYLTVDELASDATPKVVVATGSVNDKAGNAIAGNDASRTETASDGLAPNLTVTVTGTGAGDRPVTKGKITVSVTSDERLTGRPDVVIKKVGADYMLTGDDMGGDADPTGTTNEYSSSWTISAAGVYNVYVTGEDRSADSGSGSKGMMALGSADKFKDSKTILFEVDTAVADPAFSPTNNGDTDNPNVFITVNFASEGNEYQVSTDPKKTPDNADDDVKVDVDTHGSITVTSAMFNGEAVEMNTRDNMLFTYRPGNLSLGDHKLELEVTDNAGNERKGTTKLSLSFTVKERAAWVLKLDAGTNLVSLPANPTNGAIDTVFGDEAITRVVTRDNATGLWMVASKGSDGSFAGDLTTIDGGHGYWVVSDAPVDVMIDLPPQRWSHRPPARHQGQRRLEPRTHRQPGSGERRL